MPTTRQLAELLERETDAKEIFIALAARDVGDACDLLRPVWEGTRGRDGYVSIEVDPSLAYDADATVEEAMRLHALIDRPNLLVKIPATQPGLSAIEDMIAKRKVDQRHADLLPRPLRGCGRVLPARPRAARCRRWGR